MPYGNNTDVLFEKAFFCGGSIDNRAFQPYTIGPGGYKPTTTIQQFGSIKLAFNFEHRFDIFKLLQGAAFIDGGNVWLNQPDPNRPLADFNVNRFYNEFAIGAGLGARLNFNFFIIRLDAALPVKDPSRPIGNRFVLNEITMGNVVDKTTFNLGIGYPF
jgi:outer membrane protein insertion porin family